MGGRREQRVFTPDDDDAIRRPQFARAALVKADCALNLLALSFPAIVVVDEPG